MQKCSSFNGLTSTISEAPVITHRAEVLKDKDSHSWDNEQHHKHHNPDVSAEGLWGRKKKSVLRVKTENKEILINLPIYSLMQHAFLKGKQTRGVYIPSDNQGLDWGGIRGYAWASPFIWWASQGLFSFKHIKRTASFWDYRDSFCIGPVSGSFGKWYKWKMYQLWSKWIILDWFFVYDVIYMATPHRGDLGKVFTNAHKPQSQIHSQQT